VTPKISWLNPTPHTIAVHAIAGDGATLASSGRRPFPAPVFRRLDHASFARRTIEAFQRVARDAE
jgi:hypothetical protein